jgi:hypothetical protein
MVFLVLLFGDNSDLLVSAPYTECFDDLLDNTKKLLRGDCLIIVSTKNNEISMKTLIFETKALYLPAMTDFPRMDHRSTSHQ